jgi:hydroxymethylpyrimidine/phosphomethylpyrimidine kinase
MPEAEVVMTIGGSDSGGGAGIQADIKTFSALGLHGTSVITAVTAQNTLGVQKVFGLSPEAVLMQLQSVTDDFSVSFAKTGMLYSSDVVSVVAEHLRKIRIPLVLDPVIEAEAGGRLLRSKAVEALKDLLIPLARVVTPNIFEAEALTGIRVNDVESAKLAAQKIADMGAEAAVVKGGHLDCTDLLLEKGYVHLIRGQRRKGGNHGVGCTYSAALTSFLALGRSLEEAASSAQRFAAEAIFRSMSVGRGVAPVNQAGKLREEADGFRTQSDVRRAIEMLMHEPGLPRRLLERGWIIGMATANAIFAEDVVTLEACPASIGNTARVGSTAVTGSEYLAGCVRFESCSPVAGEILAAMSFDHHRRAAVSLSFDDFETCRDMELDVVHSNEERPADVEASRQSVTRIIKETGRVPDAICYAVSQGKSMVTITGSCATETASKTIELIKRINVSDGKI